MATRLYFKSTTAGPITPASTDASWANTASKAVLSMSVTNTGTVLTNKDVLNYTNDLSDCLVYQFVSPPIDAATLTGTFQMIIKCLGTPSGAWMVGHAVVRVLSGDGTTVRGTVVSSVTMGGTTRFAQPTTASTILFPTGGGTAACTSTSITSGDRLVIEVGFENQNLSTDDVTMRVGENGGSDFAYTELLTTDLNPWCEFSQNLTFQAESGGTKFYFPNTANTSGLTPTVHTNWDGGQAPTNFARYNLVTTKNNTALTNISTTVAAIVEECQLQFISLPIDAQTINGTVSIGIMQIVQTIGAVYFAYNIWVCTSAGAVRGVLLDRTANTANAINSSLNYTHEYDGAVAISSVVCSAGDRVVVEIGYDVNNSTSKTMGCRLGDLTANSDIASDSTTTTDVNGIAKFSFTIVFQSSSGGKNSLMMMGCGT